MFLKLRLFSSIGVGVKEKIKQEIKSAFQAKDSHRVGTLKLLQADIINFEKSGAEIKGESDYLQALQSVKDRFMSTIQSYKEMLKKSTKPAESSRLTELLEKETKELQILESFLPKPYSVEEIKEILGVDGKFADLSSTASTQFPELMKFLKGRIDYTRIGKSELSRLLHKICQ